MAETIELELMAEIDFDGPANWLTLGTDYDGQPIVCDGARQGSIVTEAYFKHGVVVPEAERQQEQRKPILAWTFTAGRITAFTVPNPGAFFYFVRRLPNGGLMIADGRQRGASPNVWIMRRSQLATTFSVGDGIEDMQVTPAGELWVSRFDEGIFRNATMNAGLSRFTLEGFVEFESKEAEGERRIPPIHDCYALNVDGEGGAWICYYSDFPLVKVTRATPTVIAAKSPVTAARAFAIRGDTVVFASSREKRDSLFAWDRKTGAVREVVPTHYRKGVVVTAGAGRGRELYLLEGKRLFRVPELD